jgi:hypothetical protein
VKRRGKTVDMSDVLQDPVVIFQRKWAQLLHFYLFFQTLFQMH